MRNIVREFLFEDNLADLFNGDITAGDRFVFGAEVVLAREPTVGYKISETMWGLALPPLGDRCVVLYYTFDEHTVFFLAIT